MVVACPAQNSKIYQLVLPLHMLVTGNISALTPTSLRNENNTVVAELPMKAVCASLKARYNKPFGEFCARPLRRELESILRHI